MYPTSAMPSNAPPRMYESVQVRTSSWPDADAAATSTPLAVSCSSSASRSFGSVDLEGALALREAFDDERHEQSIGVVRSVEQGAHVVVLHEHFTGEPHRGRRRSHGWSSVLPAAPLRQSGP